MIWILLKKQCLIHEESQIVLLLISSLCLMVQIRRSFSNIPRHYFTNNFIYPNFKFFFDFSKKTKLKKIDTQKEVKFADIDFNMILCLDHLSFFCEFPGQNFFFDKKQFEKYNQFLKSIAYEVENIPPKQVTQLVENLSNLTNWKIINIFHNLETFDSNSMQLLNQIIKFNNLRVSNFQIEENIHFYFKILLQQFNSLEKYENNMHTFFEDHKTKSINAMDSHFFKTFCLLKHLRFFNKIPFPQSEGLIHFNCLFCAKIKQIILNSLDVCSSNQNLNSVSNGYEIACFHVFLNLKKLLLNQLLIKSVAYSSIFTVVNQLFSILSNNNSAMIAKLSIIWFFLELFSWYNHPSEDKDQTLYLNVSILFKIIFKSNLIYLLIEETIEFAISLDINYFKNLWRKKFYVMDSYQEKENRSNFNYFDSSQESAKTPHSMRSIKSFTNSKKSKSQKNDTKESNKDRKNSEKNKSKQATIENLFFGSNNIFSEVSKQQTLLSKTATLYIPGSKQRTSEKENSYGSLSKEKGNSLFQNKIYYKDLILNNSNCFEYSEIIINEHILNVLKKKFNNSILLSTTTKKKTKNIEIGFSFQKLNFFQKLKKLVSFFKLTITKEDGLIFTKKQIKMDYLKHFIEVQIKIVKESNSSEQKKENYFSNFTRIALHLIIGINQHINTLVDECVWIKQDDSTAKQSKKKSKKKKKKEKPNQTKTKKMYLIDQTNLISIGLLQQLLNTSLNYLNQLNRKNKKELLLTIESLSNEDLELLLNVYPSLIDLPSLSNFQEILMFLVNEDQLFRKCIFSRESLALTQKFNGFLLENFMTEIKNLSEQNSKDSTQTLSLKDVNLSTKINMTLFFTFDWNIKNMNFLFLKNEKPRVQDFADNFDSFGLSFYLFEQLNSLLDSNIQEEGDLSIIDLFQTLPFKISPILQNYIFNLQLGVLFIECT